MDGAGVVRPDRSRENLRRVRGVLPAKSVSQLGVRFVALGFGSDGVPERFREGIARCGKFRGSACYSVGIRFAPSGESFARQVPAARAGREGLASVAARTVSAERRDSPVDVRFVFVGGV